MKLLPAFILLCLLLCSTPTGTEQPHPVNTQAPSRPLIEAMIKVESSGNPKAVSRCGAQGLMQVRWSVWKDELRRAEIAYRKQDLFDPETNVRAGSYVLAHYLRKHNGNLPKALHAYSGGARGYVRKVMEAKGGK